MTATQRARRLLRRRFELLAELRTAERTATAALAEIARLNARLGDSHRHCISFADHLRMTHRAEQAEARAARYASELRRLGAYGVLDR